MPLILNILLRLVLAAAGLVFAAVVALMLLAVLSVWLLRAAWARLTGRPVAPFIVRMGPRRAFEEMVRRAAPSRPSRTPRADAAGGPRRPVADVTDVRPK